jgi:hypothetical protein
MLQVSEVQFELKMNELSFNQVLQQAVDDTFAEILNRENDAMYAYLESAFKIKKEEIPSKLAEFTVAIEKTFGSAAGLVEIKIIVNIHKSVKNYLYRPSSAKLDFCDYLLDLKQFLA